MKGKQMARTGLNIMGSISDEICDSHGLYVFHIGPENLTDLDPTAGHDEIVVGHDEKPLAEGYYYCATEGGICEHVCFLTDPVGPFKYRREALAALLAEIIDV
jgi:hypothetical protein